MASSSEAQLDKTVTGYPATPNQVATGYPTNVAVSAAATTTNNAYTYVYGLPPATSSASHGPSRPISYNHSTSVRPTLHRLFLFSIGAFLVIALVYFTTYFVLKPKLPEFRVNSANLSQLNLTQSELTATWVFNLFVKNPNHKLSIRYDSLKASVLYGDELALATTRLAPFFQDRNNESTVNFQLDAIREYLGEDLVNDISEGRNRGSIDFGVRVYAWVRFGTGIWKLREHVLLVQCNQIRIGYLGISGNGTSISQLKKCEVFL